MSPDHPSSEWQPLSIRDTEKARTYAALVDGVPPWLAPSLWRWTMDRAAQGSMPLVYKAERHLRIQLQVRKVDVQAQSLFDNYWQASSEVDRLNLVDFLLRDLHKRFQDAMAAGPSQRDRVAQIMAAMINLTHMLKEAGSLWTTASEPYWRLIRRVDETTQAHVDLASSPQTDAARKIAAAWSACYERDPDYDKAYRYAVLAVEAAAIPAVIPQSDLATLGTVVAHIRDTVDNWTVGGLDTPKQPSGQTLLAMLKTLWHNQQRHANSDGTIQDVTRPEAEATVGLAVTLVHYFASGLIHRRED